MGAEKRPAPTPGGVRGRRVALVALGLWLGACGGGYSPILECRPTDEVGVLCGLQNPEDLAVVAGTPLLIVSQYGGLDGERPGGLAAVDIHSGRSAPLFPAGGPGGEPGAPPAGALWGDAECRTPPSSAFAPHGIDLTRRDEGPLQLLVVNHGGREAVEFFELSGGASGVAVAWRGCVRAPDAWVLNDVVALRNGGFLVSQMLESQGGWTWLRALLGLDTGAVFEWTPGRALREVAGTRGSLPNGIEVSGDEQAIFENLYGSNEVRKVSRRDGRTLAVAEVSHPDNLSWAADGRLLVASHRGSLRDIRACAELEAGSCPLPFAILALDPETLWASVLFASAGPPLGAGTVAVQISTELFIGSFAGDRIARVQTRR